MQFMSATMITAAAPTMENAPLNVRVVAIPSSESRSRCYRASSAFIRGIQIKARTEALYA